MSVFERINAQAEVSKQGHAARMAGLCAGHYERHGDPDNVSPERQRADWWQVVKADNIPDVPLIWRPTEEIALLKMRWQQRLAPVPTEHRLDSVDTQRLVAEDIHGDETPILVARGMPLRTRMLRDIHLANGEKLVRERRLLRSTLTWVTEVKVIKVDTGALVSMYDVVA